MTRPFNEKRASLDALLRARESLIIAFSGGVDSSALLVAAVRTLPVGRVLAVTADSASYPDSDRRDALECARALGVEHLIVYSKEVENPLYAANDGSRCYYCKTELFTILEPVRVQRGIDSIAYGEIADDAGDYRPGQRAAREHGVLAPLRDAEFTKEDVRELLRREGFMALSKKPASACLSSRVPYGTPVIPKTLRQIGACEEFLRARGYRVVRVRHHGDVARLELDQEGMSRALDLEEREAIQIFFKEQGYTFVAIDILGYRTGSLNQTISR